MIAVILVIIVIINTLYHQHYPSLGLDEGVRVVHHHGIDLCRSNRLAVLAQMQLPAVDDTHYLLRTS